MEKEQIKFYIERNLNKQLRELINRKYEKYERGLLSAEINLAIAAWIDRHTQMHAGFSINPRPRTAQVADAVKNYLTKKNGFRPQQVTLDELTNAISVLRGNDKRTIGKWLKEFAKWRIIKEVAPSVFELV